MIPAPPVLRPAATVILVRDGTQGIEVFMMQRTHRADFVPGAYVFPGGSLDATDFSSVSEVPCSGLEDASASRLLKLERGGLAHWIAAIRECFEESGLLLARDLSGRLVELQDSETTQHLSACRKKLAAGELTLADICRSRNIQLATDKLVYFSHWITPPIAPRRFDTRFFIAEAPPAQTASHDDSETINHLWIGPAKALANHHRGELNLVFATVKILESLTGFHDTATLMAHAHGLTSIATIISRPAVTKGGRHFLIPEDDAYAEVGKLDPDGIGNASCEILPGVVTRLSGMVRRIASPNPHFMRGPGTNTYLVGAGNDIAVIDPGPAIEDHVRALLEQAGGRIRWIFVTHTHPDHSSAAMLLKTQTGAELLGMPSPASKHQDQSFLPDRILSHGERIHVAGCVIRAIHSPGHASNHLCYLLEDEQLLFTGDHVMQESTVVINPPDGDMCDYFASLRTVQNEDVAWLAPGHGFLMDTPRARIGRLLAHRQSRENKVLAALERVVTATIDELLPVVYADVPSERLPMASRSLLAHLVKLRGEGRAAESRGQWRHTVRGRC